MAKEQGPLSGFRDFLAPALSARQQVLDVITSTYELYGFAAIKTPALEKYETLSGKYGEEATTLMYDFKDRGERHLALRYDHTVPLARIMAMHANSLALPFKRYVVGDVWRGESPQAGRYREFTQIDADIVGSDSYLADCEVLAMMADVFNKLKIEVTIFVNDRRLLDGLAESCNITSRPDFNKFIGLIDKVTKIGADKVLESILKDFGEAAKDAVAKLLNQEINLDNVSEYIGGPKAQQAADNLKQIFTTIAPLGLHNVKFDPTIARGLNYYTSTIYETIVDKLPSLGSVCSGGRYDQLIKDLGGPELEAIGTSIGLDRLMDAMTELNLIDTTKSKTVAYVTNLDKNLDSDRLALAHRLRKNGIPTEIYYSESRLGKQIEAASKLGIDKVIIYGQNEHQKGVALIKDLKTSEQNEVALDNLIDALK